MKLDDFNPYQKSQIDLFRMIYPESVPILEQHPEWSSTLMNMVSNYMRDGKDWQNVVKFAEATPRVTSSDECGKIGRYDMLMNYQTFVDMNCVDDVVRSLQSNSDVSVNKLLYDMICQHSDKVGRVKLNQRFDDSCFAIMSEGDDNVKDLLKSVQWQSDFIDKNEVKFRPMLGSHLVPGCLNLLALDDMNIRGQQVNYAYEYCDNDITTFVKKLSVRDADMINYVNCKSVQMGREQGWSCVDKAITDDASFYSQRPHIYESEYDLYDTPVKSLEVDWSTREIYSGTSFSDAMKILEASGFEMVYNQKENYVDDLLKDVRHIIMHNPKTGAIMDAGAAKDDDMCYGGCEIIMASNCGDDLYPKGFGFSRVVERNRIPNQDGMCVNRMQYHDGLMEQYRSVLDELGPVSDTTVLGYGFHGIPLLKSESYAYQIRGHKDYKHSKLISLMEHDGGGYIFDNFVTCLKMPDEIENVVPEKRWLYQPFLDNRYEETLRVCHFTNDVQVSSFLLGAAFKLCGTPESEIDKYYDAAKEVCSRLHDIPYHAQAMKMLEFSRNLFYGEDNLTYKFFDEYNLSMADKTVKHENRVKRAEALVSSVDNLEQDVSFDMK